MHYYRVTTKFQTICEDNLMKQTNRKFRAFSTQFFFLVGIALSTSLVWAFSHPEAFTERVSNTGGVIISAQYVAPEANLTDETAFRINLSTHYVDLSRYDLRTSSFIRIDDGPLQQAVDWDASGTNHHIQGILKFVGNQAQESMKLQLIIKGVGKSEDRVFEWKASNDS